eukprot:351138-Chlamydomonas_euryale.AAC.18
MGQRMLKTLEPYAPSRRLPAVTCLKIESSITRHVRFWVCTLHTHRWGNTFVQGTEAEPDSGRARLRQSPCRSTPCCIASAGPDSSRSRPSGNLWRIEWQSMVDLSWWTLLMQSCEVRQANIRQVTAIPK